MFRGCAVLGFPVKDWATVAGLVFVVYVLARFLIFPARSNGAAAALPESWEAESLIQRYGLLLRKVAGEGLVDLGRLPVGKNRMREVLLLQIRNSKDSKTRDVLCAGYLELSRFQPGLASARAAASAYSPQSNDRELNRMLAAAAKIVAESPPELAAASEAELLQLRKDIAPYMLRSS
jgi:hypothetical protein